jgi:hypothetical protein
LFNLLDFGINIKCALVISSDIGYNQGVHHKAARASTVCVDPLKSRTKSATGRNVFPSGVGFADSITSCRCAATIAGLLNLVQPDRYSLTTFNVKARSSLQVTPLHRGLTLPGKLNLPGQVAWCPKPELWLGDGPISRFLCLFKPHSTQRYVTAKVE